VRAAVAGLVAAFAVAACGGSSTRHDLNVYNPGGGRAGEQQGNVRRNVPYTFATGFPLCTRGDPVTITSVSLHQPHGPLHLVDWAVWPTYGYVDTVPGSARRSSYSEGVRITMACNRKVRQVLAVSMKITGRRGYTRGFDVRSDGGSATVPFPIALCTRQNCPPPPGVLPGSSS
jgi:hypothetical protein